MMSRVREFVFSLMEERPCERCRRLTSLICAGCRKRYCSRDCQVMGPAELHPCVVRVIERGPQPAATALRKKGLVPGAAVVVTAGFEVPRPTQNVPPHVPAVGERFTWEWGPEGGSPTGYDEFEVSSVTVFAHLAGAVRLVGMSARKTREGRGAGERSLTYDSATGIWRLDDGSAMRADAMTWQR